MKLQLLDHAIIRLAGCKPQLLDFVPPHMVSHVGLAGAGQQLRGGGAVWAVVEALKSTLRQEQHWEQTGTHSR